MREITTKPSRLVGDPVHKAHRRRDLLRRWAVVSWVLPAFAAYCFGVLYPLTQSIRYSFYDWDGVGVATPVGIGNYVAIFTQSVLFESIIHAFVLIIFFTVFPVGLGLISAAFMREVRAQAFSTTARVILFIPQVVPLAGAAIAWTWMYAENGPINQLLRLIGLGSIAQDWLGGFDSALPAVGLIGTWVTLGFCAVLLQSGMGKIDPSLYEAAQLDGAGRLRQFFSVSVPGLRRELVVCVTITIISALSSFDLVYIATNGGPGYATMVPGVKIYQLVFSNQQIGLASALGVVLAVLIFVVVLPIQRLGREK